MADARLRRDVAWNMVPVALLAAVGLGTNFAIYTWWNGETLAVFNLVTTAFFVLAVVGAWGLQFSVLRAIDGVLLNAGDSRMEPARASSAC